MASTPKTSFSPLDRIHNIYRNTHKMHRIVPVPINAFGNYSNSYKNKEESHEPCECEVITSTK